MAKIVEKPSVERLGYVGGQDEELGGFCEPLIIRTDGKEHYVLHEMHTYYEQIRKPDGWGGFHVQFGNIKAKHSKVEFETLDELVKEFRKVIRRLGINPSLPWKETDHKCGYDLPDESYNNAPHHDMFIK